MYTLATIPASDVTVGMTVAFSLDGTYRARVVTETDRTDTVTLLWVGDYALATASDAPVSVEIH